ncbi:MAG: HlyD family efflux transporter periplasmic adaptor subunit [Kiritimatiellaeota bacterium]|nr:HlyD family efflux transporter periplasmic adaptor subunit [Kiritimatiellota bacterium]
MKKEGFKRKPTTLLSACLVCALLTLAPGCVKREESQKQVSDRLFVVKKGDFPVVFRVDGQLDAIRNHQLAFRGKRGSRELKLTYVLPEHSIVSSNDVVFQISDEFFKRQETDLLRQIQTAEQRYEMAQQDVSMIQADNINDLKSSLDTLRTGIDALRRYENEDAPKRKKELQQGIQTKIESFNEADANVQDARKVLLDVSSGDENVKRDAERKVTAAETAQQTAQQAVETAFYDLRIFKRYDHSQKITSLRDTVKRNTIAVQRGIVNNENRLRKNQIELSNSRALLDNYRNELKEVREDMARLEIRAPVSGTLFYGNPDGTTRFRGNQPEELREGAEVYIGQVMGFIPDLSKFMVTASIPEEFRSRVQSGLKVHIKAKAIPDLVLNGEIASIAAAATPIIGWDPRSPKVYTTKISTDIADERLVPGMTVQVEIIVETVTGAFFVPVEAVYNREGKSYVKVANGINVEERAVTTGRFSADYIEILEGLAEGESVLLVRVSS